MTLILDNLPYVPAAHNSGSRVGDPTMVVLHTAENNEGSTAAEGVALFFADGTDPNRGSAQLCVDDDSAVRSVPDDIVAWAAGEGDANRVGVHYEICGRAGQTATEWADEFSAKALGNTADLVRQHLARYPHIRPVRLTADQLRGGARNGLCGHADYHAAYPAGDYRYDPGDEFPWERFLGLVKSTTPTGAHAMGTLLYSSDSGLTRYLEFPMCTGLTQQLIDHYNALNVPIVPVSEAYAQTVSNYCNKVLELGPGVVIGGGGGVGGVSEADIEAAVKRAIGGTKLVAS